MKALPFIKTSLAVFALVGAALGATQTLAADSLQAILARDVVRIGAVSAPPWYQKDLRTNEWTGLVPDLAQAIFTPSGIAI